MAELLGAMHLATTGRATACQPAIYDRHWVLLARNNAKSREYFSSYLTRDRIGQNEKSRGRARLPRIAVCTRISPFGSLYQGGGWTSGRRGRRVEKQPIRCRDRHDGKLIVRETNGKGCVTKHWPRYIRAYTCACACVRSARNAANIFIEDRKRDRVYRGRLREGRAAGVSRLLRGGCFINWVV